MHNHTEIIYTRSINGLLQHYLCNLYHSDGYFLYMSMHNIIIIMTLKLTAKLPCEVFQFYALHTSTLCHIAMLKHYV